MKPIKNHLVLTVKRIISCSRYIILLSIFFYCFSISSYAQELAKTDSGPGNRKYISITPSYGLSYYRKHVVFNYDNRIFYPGLNFQFGYLLKKHWQINAGFEYLRSGAKYDFDQYDLAGNKKKGKAEIDYHYLNITGGVSAIIGKHFSLNAGLFGGKKLYSPGKRRR